MRIVAGLWGGRLLESPRSGRPTTERVRESLFSIWRERVEGARFLDLFCAGGAMGLEAASRGAAQVVFVDHDAGALSVARRNCESLPFEDFEAKKLVLPGALDHGKAGALGAFDLVYADPPYEFAAINEVVIGLGRLLDEGGLAAVEHARRQELPAASGPLERFDVRTYGETSVSFFSRRSSALRHEEPEEETTPPPDGPVDPRS